MKLAPSKSLLKTLIFCSIFFLSFLCPNAIEIAQFESKESFSSLHHENHSQARIQHSDQSFSLKTLRNESLDNQTNKNTHSQSVEIRQSHQTNKFSQKRLLVDECGIPGCLQCLILNFPKNATICLRCQYPQIISFQMNSCSATVVETNSSNCSIPNCQKCSIISEGSRRDQICTKCSKYSRFGPKICLQDSSFQLYKYDQNYRCHSSCINCKISYSGFETCTACKNGYFNAVLSLTSSLIYSCRKCSRICAKCQFSPQNCTLCFSGYILNNQTCLKCFHDSCDSCSPLNTKLCLTCKNGMFINPNYDPQNPCLPCPPNCYRCNSSQICLRCQQSYFSKSNSSISGCIPCPNGIRLCQQQNNFYSFGTSYPGYTLGIYNPLIEPFQQTLMKCPQNCERCDNSSSCSVCFQGFILVNGICSNHTLYCTFFHENGTCRQCKHHYKLLSSNQCIKDQNFNLTREQYCRYMMVLSFMIRESDPSNSYMCTDTQIFYDQKMASFDFDIEAQTQSLFCGQMEGCVECLSEIACTKCSDGYYLDIYKPYSLLTYTCKKCVPPCKTCYKSYSNCDSCLPNYVLNKQNYKCQDIYRLNFTVVLNSKGETLGYFLPEVLQTMTNLAGYSDSAMSKLLLIKRQYLPQDRQQIPESERLYGSIFFENPQQLKQAIQTLSSTITPGKYLIGFLVIQASIVDGTNYSLIPESNSGNSILLSEKQQFMLIAAAIGTVLAIVIVVLGIKLYQKSQIIEKGLVKSSNEMMAQDNSPKGFESQTSVLKLHPKVQTDFVIEPTKMDENELNSFASNKKTFCQIENVN